MAAAGEGGGGGDGGAASEIQAMDSWASTQRAKKTNNLEIIKESL